MGHSCLVGGCDEIQGRLQPRGLPDPEGGSVFEFVLGDRSQVPLLFSFIVVV